MREVHVESLEEKHVRVCVDMDYPAGEHSICCQYHPMWNGASPSLPLDDAHKAREFSHELWEAVQNAAGLLDTPITRRRFEGSDAYDETVQSLRSVIAKIRSV